MELKIYFSQMVKQYFSGSFVFSSKLKKRKLINQRLKKLNNSYN